MFTIRKWMVYDCYTHIMNQAVYTGPTVPPLAHQRAHPRKKSENVREGQILELRVMPNNGAAWTKGR